MASLPTTMVTAPLGNAYLRGTITLSTIFSCWSSLVDARLHHHPALSCSAVNIAYRMTSRTPSGQPSHFGTASPSQSECRDKHRHRTGELRKRLIPDSVWKPPAARLQYTSHTQDNKHLRITAVSTPRTAQQSSKFLLLIVLIIPHRLVPRSKNRNVLADPHHTMKSIHRSVSDLPSLRSTAVTS
ncbi:hypothetical protein BO94DRAFT_282462 [Aspergillus sclerotioniger CBS 115572]|uniref:Uncharacterized protein n=1 Tax=Aspergillus sclerotioniger CBS 115572 TaxID=1450535 RepID=A0A317X865_9EURO|nr:hypothetical protein BO94DRAFT_282462 [Aspergillus sclerotioniger CBS 115572]PWY94719.1 hypothetical protein BO94DRAFT_282462 [Aspergillus sclerotioniger CBS 115572]